MRAEADTYGQTFKLRDPCSRRGRRIVEAKGVEDTERTQPKESTKQHLEELTKTELATTESSWVSAGASAYMGYLWDS